jgi:hypothetical protein
MARRRRRFSPLAGSCGKYASSRMADLLVITGDPDDPAGAGSRLTPPGRNRPRDGEGTHPFG